MLHYFRVSAEPWASNNSLMCTVGFIPPSEQMAAFTFPSLILLPLIWLWKTKICQELLLLEDKQFQWSRCGLNPQFYHGSPSI